MTRTLSMAVLVGVLVLAPVGAIGEQGGYTTYGPGGGSCGKWLIEDDRSFNLSWVLGFVSGVGWSGGRTLKETDVAGIEAFIDKHCAAHPVDNIASAAAALVRELTVNTP